MTHAIGIEKNLDIKTESQSPEKAERIIDLTNRHISIRRIFLKQNIKDFFLEERFVGEYWGIDRLKLRFFFIREAAKRRKSRIDFERWEAFLNADRKDVQIDPKKFDEFISDRNIKRIIQNGLFKDASDWKELDRSSRQYAKQRGTPCPIGSRNMIYRSDVDERVRLNPDFVPFIQKIEYFECSIPKTIKEAIERTSNIKYIGMGRCLVCHHPISRYLIKKGFKTLDEFKEYVINSSNQKIFFMDRDYWIDVFSIANSYVEFDCGDSIEVGIVKVISALKITLTRRESMLCFDSPLRLRVLSGDGLYDYVIYSLTKDGEIGTCKKEQMRIHLSDFS